MTGPKFDINKVKADALAEVRKEREEDAKKRIKAKLKELDQAKTIVANLDRELTDLYASISDGN